MTEKRSIDPERPHADKPFDRDEGTFGQDYHRKDEAASADAMPAGSVAPRRSQVDADDTPVPDDNGRRASFDPETGEVRGSGAGAGGGNAGEDLATDAAGGDGFPQTGTGSRRP